MTTTSARPTTTPIQPSVVQRRSSRRVIGKGALYVFLIIIILAYIAPAYWLLTSSVKAGEDVYRYPPQWIPTKLELQNYVQAVTNVPFARFVMNSIIVTVFGTALTLMNACLSSYAVTFINFRFREPVFIFMLGAMLLPGDLHLIPNYITTANLQWLNTYQGLIIPASASVLGTFLLRQHMRTIPREVIDAAKMDRAGHWTLMTRIVLPLSRPLIVTIMVITMIGEWNRFIWPLIITNDNSKRVLPIGLLFLRSEEGTQNWGAIMAGTLLTALPMIIAFIVAQRQIIEGLTRTTTLGGKNS